MLNRPYDISNSASQTTSCGTRGTGKECPEMRYLLAATLALASSLPLQGQDVQSRHTRYIDRAVAITPATRQPLLRTHQGLSRKL
ncbi:MAG TPA: hypothetical protein VJN93_04355 [Candidatus Acidoferrum sp.]|nr:hypothetical protein [Candidatus Acidoferrum sp.]